MFKKLLLCDGPNSNQVGYDIVVYWSSFQEGDGAYSVPRVIESKSSFLKQKYLDWIYELGRSEINKCSVIDFLLIRENFSYWWIRIPNIRFNWRWI
jgi:hypothetical protein